VNPVDLAATSADADAAARASAILEAVSFAAERFLGGHWDETIAETIERLGRVAGVSRVYIFENHETTDGRLVMDPICEWAADGIERRLGEPRFRDLLLFDVWRGSLAAGEPVHQLVDELPAADRAILVAQDVRSILLVPVNVDGAWWGEISFDDSTAQRLWSTTEVDALRAAAAILGAALSRSRTEHELVRSAHVLDQVGEAAVAVDLERRVTYWNRGAERLFGYSATEALGRPIEELTHPTPAHHDEVLQATAPLRHGVASVHLETVRRRKDGSLIDVGISLSPLRNAAGELEGFVSVARDVGERKLGEAALSRREEILSAVGFAARTLLETNSIEDAIHEVLERLGRATRVSRVSIFEARNDDPARRSSSLRYEWSAPEVSSQLANPELQNASLWGDRLARGEVVRGNIEDFQPHERAVLEPQGIRSLLDVPILLGTEWWGSIGFDDCVSERTWSDGEVDALVAAAGIVGATLARDRAETALHKREEQFQYAQKSEALGRLAGAIAHDFNNVLTVISGYGDLLRSALTSDTARADADEIVKAASRGQALTQQLLSFSRRRIAQPRMVDLNDVVRDIERMLERLLDRRIRLETRLDPKLGAVEADVSQMEQVLVNLAVNARDAMQETGGTLTIATRNVDLRDGERSVPDGSYVELEVTDTGEGMDEPTRLRIFDPFFTTKPPELGTGLGLATVTEIVSQYGGDISVASSPGAGATFRILLPRAGG
jgi:two-component system cell cycle sensor histidine kinase/response regulator CckA